MQELLENSNLVESRIDRKPDNNRTVKLANAITCAKELYEIGGISEEAYKAMLLHFIELAGYESTSKDF